MPFYYYKPLNFSIKFAVPSHVLSMCSLGGLSSCFSHSLPSPLKGGWNLATIADSIAEEKPAHGLSATQNCCVCSPCSAHELRLKGRFCTVQIQLVSWDLVSAMLFLCCTVRPVKAKEDGTARSEARDMFRGWLGVLLRGGEVPITSELESTFPPLCLKSNISVLSTVILSYSLSKPEEIM